MSYIDPHIHMISRVTDDYQRMAYAGCAAVTEPAFWAGLSINSTESAEAVGAARSDHSTPTQHCQAGEGNSHQQQR